MMQARGTKPQTIALFSGSLLFQIIQVGTYPILISQFLSRGSVSNFAIGIFVSVAWIVVFAAGPSVVSAGYYTGVLGRHGSWSDHPLDRV